MYDHQKLGSIAPLLERQHKTAYQETLEACLTAVAVAFANKHYDTEFTEDDIVLRAMIMTETIIAATGHRLLWLHNRSADEKTYDPRSFFGDGIAKRNERDANKQAVKVDGGEATAASIDAGEIKIVEDLSGLDTVN